LPTALPPVLPRRRRAPEKRSLARIVFDVVFNAVLVVSALALTFIVLVREEQYAFGQQQRPDQAIEQTLDMTGETMVTPPSN
jgi:hypothetical protein